MFSPLLDVAMSFVHTAATTTLDDTTLSAIRAALAATILGFDTSTLSTLLFAHLQTTEPLTRLNEILSTAADPPPANPAQPSCAFGICRRLPRPWTATEDVRLLAAIHRHGLDNWSAVARFVGIGRDRTQCAQRWNRGLNPQISKGVWTAEEEERMLRLFAESPNQGWAQIAAKMGNRSDVQCRYRLAQMHREGKVPSPLAAQIKVRRASRRTEAPVWPSNTLIFEAPRKQRRLVRRAPAKGSAVRTCAPLEEFGDDDPGWLGVGAETNHGWEVWEEADAPGVLQR
jgi:hypothetical protein